MKPHSGWGPPNAKGLRGRPASSNLPLSGIPEGRVSDAPTGGGVTALAGCSTSRRPALRARSRDNRSGLSSNQQPRMSFQVFTPILEEPPASEFTGSSSAPPAATTGSHPPPLPPLRSAPPSHGGFIYFKDVVEAQARGDIQAASAAFKAINTQLGALPADSPEKAEIIAECGLHLLLEARRCKVENQAEDARTKAQRAADCLETSIKLQRTLTLPVRPHHYLWLGWILEFLSKRPEAHKAYVDGLAVTTNPSDGVSFELWMARVELYTEEQDWERCWNTLMAMLNVWPLVPDLYARAAVTVLRKDFNRSRIEALDAAIFWYRAAADRAPSNSYYAACITRIQNERNQAVALNSLASSDMRGIEYSSAVLPPPPPTQPRNFLNMNSQTSLASTISEYGEVLPPSQRQFTGMASKESASMSASLPPSSRPQSVGPVFQAFPSNTVPSAPEPWQLPSPSIRSRSAVSSPGPSTNKHRRNSGGTRTRSLLHRVHDAVKSIHEGVARAVTPLRERVRETQEALTQQYDQLQDRVDELSCVQENMHRTLSRRLSNAEVNIQDLKNAPRYNPDDAARRAQSVPPPRFPSASLTQDELLERSIMLYGVWALEKRLGG